jgi:LPXTG-motif cell wall-anchored protein
MGCHGGNVDALRRKVETMNTLLLIVILVLLFGGGGYYWRRGRN